MSKPTERLVSVDGVFHAPEHEPAVDLSGIASASTRGPRRCLVINNEGPYAQFATFRRKDGVLKVGELVPLLPTQGIEPFPAIGKRPAPPGDDSSGKYMLDGEGVTWLEPHYYVTGSHSLANPDKAQGKSLFRFACYVVARVTADGTRPELSFRLNEVLSEHPLLKRSHMTSTDGGLNIEGVAGRNGRLYFGLRSPVPDGEAIIVSVRAAALFSSGAALAPKTMTVPLGEGIGIRDLAAFGKRRFLVLAGPAEDLRTGFSLRLYDPRDRSVVMLGELPSGKNYRPEGLLLVRRKDDEVEVLVLHDHASNGRPRLYTFPIPP